MVNCGGRGVFGRDECIKYCWFVVFVELVCAVVFAGLVVVVGVASVKKLPKSLRTNFIMS